MRRHGTIVPRRRSGSAGARPSAPPSGPGDSRAACGRSASAAAAPGTPRAQAFIEKRLTLVGWLFLAALVGGFAVVLLI